MTGPFDPNHDLPEPVPVVLPVWHGEYNYSFNPNGSDGVTLVVIPFGWGLAVHPTLGAVLRHQVRSDRPDLLPSEVLALAKREDHGFRLA